MKPKIGFAGVGWLSLRSQRFEREPLVGHITKQGSSLLRFLLVEAAQAAVRWDPTGDVASFIWPCVATVAR
jgi:hypothetical protein